MIELENENRILKNEVQDLRAACSQYMEQIQSAIKFLCGPNSNPEQFNSKVIATNALLALTDEERLDLFSDYCRNCGKADPSCQCWNDE